MGRNRNFQLTDKFCVQSETNTKVRLEFFDIMENNLISLNFFVNFAVFLDSVASLELRANISLPNQGIIGVNNDK